MPAFEFIEVAMVEVSDELLEQSGTKKPMGGYTANIPGIPETDC